MYDAWHVNAHWFTDEDDLFLIAFTSADNDKNDKKMDQ